MDISENIKYYRKQAGYTQADLAKLLKIKPTAVSAWESGRNKPLMDKLTVMAALFGVNISQLVGDTFEVNDISPVYNKLDTSRKKSVYRYAVRQLDEQNNVIVFPKNNKSEVSVYGAVSAGTGEYLLDNTPELVPYEGVVPEHDYAVIVNGVSMRPLFEDKQIIFVKKTFEARSGQVVIAYYDNQAYVKKYVNDEKGARFVSLNKSYDDMPIDETHETQIIGVVVL
ncbi:helix-turn-helix domain-containing protein [Leuconostoc pseudomesenteroides]|uniref:helix-turn-helix domain-containing protein n=1 Tax=Leuconostoc pseudomesenteroides TaxID=33968 RepID=UPI0021A59636|nr:XRE family transcriptional regulator [Leuconostoc pseudomesenteroides]MCT4381597.1 helix-turn-helix domain-containing protein [Leuconostoc pseudomesenteroides]